MKKLLKNSWIENPHLVTIPPHFKKPYLLEPTMEMILARDVDDICNQPNLKILKTGNSVHEPKICEADDTIIKFFYPKRRLFSSDRFKPYAMRFCNNIEKLQAYGYSVPNIVKVKYCAERKLYLVYYKKLAGVDVRTIAKTKGLNFITHVSKLIADMHAQGIFFRSIHLENLLKQPDNKIGLLDIADVRFNKKPLSLYTRYRNIKHLLQNQCDAEIWKAYGINKFLKEYFSHSTLSQFSRMILTKMVMKISTGARKKK